MGLLNNNVQTAAVADTKKADTKKAAKAEKKAAKKDALATLIAFAKEKGDEKVRAAAELLTAKRTGGFGGEDIFTKLFGATPKVGDKVSAMDAFMKTEKGIGQIRKLTKAWEEKGKATVSYDVDKKEFVIVKM